MQLQELEESKAELLITINGNSQRIELLENQLADAVKDKGALADQLTALTTTTANRITELERQLASAVKDKTAVSALKDDRIAELEEHLSSTQTQMAMLMDEKTLLLEEKSALLEEKTTLTEHTLAKDERVGGMNMTVSSLSRQLREAFASEERMQAAITQLKTERDNMEEQLGDYSLCHNPIRTQELTYNL